MNLFRKIGELLSGKDQLNETTQSDTSSAERPKEESAQPNAVKMRQRIKDAVLDTLDSLYLAGKGTSQDKKLLLWLDVDDMTFGAYSDMGQEIRDYLAVERDYRFSEVVLKQGLPQDQRLCKPVSAQLLPFKAFLQEIFKGENPDMARKAMVSVVGDRGKLLQEQYELSADALTKGNKKYYTIGRGSSPMLDNGKYRQNDIAIDDVNCLELNQCVSRAHAHIGFSNLVGFYLQVELGGSGLSGGRTRVFRGEETIEVDNPQAVVPLQDGDIIELGKAVLLKYVEL